MTRPCLDCGAPTKGSRCPTCRKARGRQRAAQRGSTTERGYDAAHKRLRQQWARQVQTGRVLCARCGEPITPGSAWDLDHTDDRSGYLGPSHRLCNTRAGGRVANLAT